MGAPGQQMMLNRWPGWEGLACPAWEGVPKRPGQNRQLPSHRFIILLVPLSEGFAHLAFVMTILTHLTECSHGQVHWWWGLCPFLPFLGRKSIVSQTWKVLNVYLLCWIVYEWVLLKTWLFEVYSLEDYQYSHFIKTMTKGLIKQWLALLQLFLNYINSKSVGTEVKRQVIVLSICYTIQTFLEPTAHSNNTYLYQYPYTDNFHLTSNYRVSQYVSHCITGDIKITSFPVIIMWQNTLHLCSKLKQKKTRDSQKSLSESTIS